MPYHVAIRNCATGEVARYFWDSTDFDPEEGWYWWLDGNGGCDCNREIFWCSAKDVDEPEESPCGETRFALEYIEQPDGTRLVPPADW